jgi:hypothetical protein
MTKSNERVVAKGIKGATVHGTTTKLWKAKRMQDVALVF